MQYIRTVDQGALDGAAPTDHIVQKLLAHDSGAEHCTINWTRTPAGGGSPSGMHVHSVDQIFFVLAGTMSIEIEDTRSEVGPGTLVIFPKGVPHRNWNQGDVPTEHLVVNVPLADPTEQFARPV